MIQKFEFTDDDATPFSDNQRSNFSIHFLMHTDHYLETGGSLSFIKINFLSALILQK